MEKEYVNLSINDAAKAISVTRGTLESYIRSGRVKVSPDGTINTAALVQAGFIIRSASTHSDHTIKDEERSRMKETDVSNEKAKGIVLLIIGIASVGTMLLIGMLLKDQGGLRGVFQGKSLLIAIPLFIIAYYGIHKGLDILFRR